MRPGFFYYRRRLDRRALIRVLSLLLAVSLLVNIVISWLQRRLSR